MHCRGAANKKVNCNWVGKQVEIVVREFGKVW